MQKGYALVGMHAIKNTASPYKSLYLFSYKITIMKINNQDRQLMIVLGKF